MTLLFGALAWFVGGRSWFTNILAAVVVGSLAGVGGYVAGRIHGSDAATIAALHRQRDFLQAELVRRDEADELARKLAAEAAEIDTTNLTVLQALEAHIEKAPVVSGCVAPGFLDGLRKLR